MARKTVVVIAFFTGFATSQIDAQPLMDAPEFSWLEGCWQHLDGSTEEVWERGFEGLLFGRSVTIHQGHLTAFEDMRIQKADDHFTFFASPNGRVPVEFTSTVLGRNYIVFENAAHDFPQRISYERDDEKLRCMSLGVT